LFFSFVTADSGEQDSEERETIISDMDTLVNLFIEQLKTDYENDVEFTQIKTEPQYQI
jgi:hypothetical protein